jgi:alginate O-acetyltransferase complex protein AlgI
MLLLSPGGKVILPTDGVALVSVVVVGMLFAHWTMRNRRLEDVVSRAPWWLLGLIWAAMLFAILITQGVGDAFIYFQF